MAKGAAAMHVPGVRATQSSGYSELVWFAASSVLDAWPCAVLCVIAFPNMLMTQMGALVVRVPSRRNAFGYSMFGWSVADSALAFVHCARFCLIVFPIRRICYLLAMGVPIISTFAFLHDVPWDK